MMARFCSPLRAGISEVVFFGGCLFVVTAYLMAPTQWKLRLALALLGAFFLLWFPFGYKIRE